MSLMINNQKISELKLKTKLYVKEGPDSIIYIQ